MLRRPIILRSPKKQKGRKCSPVLLTASQPTCKTSALVTILDGLDENGPDLRDPGGNATNDQRVYLRRRRLTAQQPRKRYDFPC